MLLVSDVGSSEGAGGAATNRAIRIEGNQRVYKDPILIHIEQEPGQALDEGVVDYDLKSIYKMGFFESVRANLEYIKGEPVLVYTVRERPQIIDVRIDGMNALSRTDSRVVQAVGSINGEILTPSKSNA